SIEKIESFAEAAAGLEGGDVEKFKSALFLVEAHAAQRYFRAISRILPEEVGFNGRVQRTPVDQFNMALNYCYGILKGVVSNYLDKYGISKYIGMLHSHAADRISFTFDVMEEFRQATCDLALISFFRNGGRIVVEKGKIELESRRKLASIFFSRLNSVFKYNGGETNMAEIIESKIAEIRGLILGEGPHRPFVLKW
ncbi:MAG TPA: CRISPR-associated endonuclease Cas1, partial [Candidatus Wallbacteria bacterium]|nr:CRISPR-associated endonuclease Cas1 [Candidatus Wallbacteria bacterium]